MFKILNKVLILSVVLVVLFSFFATQIFAQKCPDLALNEFNAIPYDQRTNPDPMAGGFETCYVDDDLYSYCSQYLTDRGYCMDIIEFTVAQSSCCSNENASCSVDDQPGVCSSTAENSKACSSGLACEVINLADVDSSDLGDFYCGCINNGTNWVCTPQDNPLDLIANRDGGGCPAWSAPDIGSCSTTLPSDTLPSFCNRSDNGVCGNTLSCVSLVTDEGKPLKAHGEECVWNYDSDECDASQGLQCTTIEGIYRCAFSPGTRGGFGVASGQTSCKWDFECITKIGIDDSPANDFECTSSPGIICNPVIDDSCSCTPPEGTWENNKPVDTNPAIAGYDICTDNLGKNLNALKKCTDCMDNDGLWTSIGCIEKDPKGLVSKLITIGTGILGGIFLLRVLAASFMLTTSQGDVKKTSEAKQMITEAIIGVLFVIFSVTILQFIGSDVMRLPGFGG